MSQKENDLIFFLSKCYLFLFIPKNLKIKFGDVFLFYVFYFQKPYPNTCAQFTEQFKKGLLSVFLKVTSFVNNFMCNTFLK